MGIEGIKSQKVARLHEYWCSIKGARHMPARTDIDPAEIKSILPNLMLVEVTAEPFRIRYRIVGTEVVRVTGVEFTNSYLDELASSIGDGLDLDYWLRQYRTCCETREPIFGISKLSCDGHWRQSFEWAILPLSTNGIDVDMAIAVEDYESRG